MALDDAQLALDIQSFMGFLGDNSSEVEGMATAIVDHLKTGVVNNLPGTINATALPAGGPITLGTGAGGTITLVPGSLVPGLVAAFGSSTPQIISISSAITSFFLTGLVTFAPGTITGTSTNTPSSPGVLTLGAGSGGLITGLVPSVLATSLAAAVGSTVTSQITGLANAITSHVLLNAEVSYPSNSINGNFIAGGGPMLLGSGVGGTII